MNGNFRFGLRMVLYCALFVGAVGVVFAQVSATAQSKDQTAAAEEGSHENPVVFSFNGKTVTARDFHFFLISIPPQQREQYSGKGGQRAYAENLARLMILAQAAEKEKLDREPDVAAQLESVRDQVLAYAEQQAILRRAMVSDEQIKKFYDQNQGKLFQLHLLHISLPLEGSGIDPTASAQVRSTLESLRNRALHGEDFKKLAQGYSKDSDAKKGGDLGFVGRGKLGDQVDNVVFQLKPGDVSDVIVTPVGMHIFKVLEQRPESLEDAKSFIGDVLKGQMLPLSLSSMFQESQLKFNDAYFANDLGVNSMAFPVTTRMMKNGKQIGTDQKGTVVIPLKK